MLRETARHQRSTIVEYFLRNDDLFIWIISPNGEINFHQHQQPGLQQSLTDLVAATRTSLGVQTREAVFKGVPQPPQQFLPRLAELYRLLVEPLKDWLPHNEHEPVIFIPHGILFMVPFPTLFDQQKYLIDRHTIAVAPSIRFVETTYQLAAGRKTYPPGILIVGDPLMPVWRADDDRPAERLPQLEFARKEAEEVARKLGATAVLGAQASKQKIVASLPQQQIIHLSTHGLLDAHRSPADMPGAIALAPEDEDDGFLTAAHIAALALQAKIVVMSACNTGQGRLSADGILGLVRAFLTAGAECVVASLWAVSDLSTQELMVEFYEHLLRGLPVGSALRQAMLTLKADERHAYPLYWAAFTVTGQSQRPLFDVIQDEAILSRQET
jgi:CHAT domain-containing protein